MLQDGGNNAGQPLPALSFSLELKAALCAQPVKLCVTASLGRTPFGDQKTLVFQAMKCGVQRALLDLQRIFRDHLDALRNRISVNRSERDDTKNEQVQRSLGKVKFGWSRHTCFFYIYTTMCRRERCDLTSGPAKPVSVPKSKPHGLKNRLCRTCAPGLNERVGDDLLIYKYKPQEIAGSLLTWKHRVERGGPRGRIRPAGRGSIGQRLLHAASPAMADK